MKRKTTELFVQQAKKRHKNRYDYSETNYIDYKTPVKILCKKHGAFLQSPGHHIKGSGCPKCKFEKLNKLYKLSEKTYIKKAQSVHGDKYKYDLTNYKNCNTKIKITCPYHGPFIQRALAHLQGSGCPVCRGSRNERAIVLFLIKNKINYKHQYKIKECKYKAPLIFDIAILDFKNNIKCLIEYQGEQHFIPKSYFGGEIAYLKQKKRDRIKKSFCNKNNIPLFYITYTQDTIKRLSEILTTVGVKIND